MEDDGKKIFEPKRLAEQCVDVCVKYPKHCLLCRNGPSAYDYDDENSMDIDDIYKEFTRLRTSKYIPATISELLFERLLDYDQKFYINVFSDTEKCKLTKLNFSPQKLNFSLKVPELISNLFRHPLQELILSGCNLSTASLDCLKQCANSLKVLDLSAVPGVKGTFVLKDLKNLQRLNLSNTEIGYHKEQLTHIGNLKNLVWLDLSSSPHINDANLKELIPLNRKLAWLSLYNCKSIRKESCLIELLEKFKSLVHLDLSKVPTENKDVVAGPVVNGKILSTLTTLSKLKSLDISGCLGLTEEEILHLPNLKFFGLAFTGLSFHKNVPANMVTGECTEEQLLNSLEVYMRRETYTANALRKLFTLTKVENCKMIGKSLKLMLKSMRTYPKSETINIAASASVYHLSRQNHPEIQNVALRREIVETLVYSMGSIEKSLQLQKNCVLTLCNFRIPAELEFQWFIVAKALLCVLTNHKNNYIRRISIMLFNTIVCQVKCEITGQQKRSIGKLGAVDIVIEIINEKLTDGESDQLLETCWSSLWNMTDETPENCHKFLDGGGMTMFLKCLEIFPNSFELHRNMMGLMGNIGEVHELRLRLLTDEYINVFVSLVCDERSLQNEQLIYLEISYNAAGLLSHLLSEGPEVWNIKSITRDQCMETMFNYIERWDIQAERSINYRSFKPILKLLPCQHAPAAQHWAAWALANLTKVYPHKYCKLLEEEDGLVLLEHMKQMPRVHPRTKYLADLILESCKNQVSFRVA